MNPRIVSLSQASVAGVALAVVLFSGSAGAQTHRIEKHFSVDGQARGHRAEFEWPYPGNRMGQA